MKAKLLKNEKGNVLVFTMIVVFALVAIAAPFFAVGLIELNISQNQTYRIQAFYLADAGISYGNNYIRATTGIIPTTVSATQTMSYSGQTVGSFSVTISLLTTANNVSLYRIVSIGTPTNTYSQASIIAITKSGSFNDYLVYRDTMSAPFGTGYVADGPMYIGSNIYTSGTPTFEGKVTVVGTLDNEGGGNPSFIGGVQYGANSVSAPPGYAISSVMSIASTSGFADNKFGNKTTAYSGATVTFNMSTVTIRVFSTVSASLDSTIVYAIPSTGLVIGMKEPLYVSGTVNGQVNVVSDSTIEIESNLVYSNTSSNSTDILGLMTLAWVDISSNAPANITIDAAIYARTNPIGVFDAGPALTVPMGTLILNGSYATYANGSFQSGSDGFSERDFNYDPRFAYLSPPYFFTTTQFEQIYWKNAYFL